MSSDLPQSTAANNQIGSRRRPLVAAAVVLASVTLSNAAFAQNAIWINPGGSSSDSLLWSTPANWQDGATPEGVSFYPADFSTLNITGDRTVTLSGPGSAAGLIFGDTDVSSAGSWTLASSGDPTTNVLTLTGMNGPNAIVVKPLGTGKTVTISSNINVTNAPLSKQGDGTLVLGGSTKLNGYQLEVKDGGTLVIKGATTDASQVFVRGTSSLILDTGAALTSGTNTNGDNYLSIGVNGVKDILSADGTTVVGVTPADNVTAIMRGNATWTHTGGDFNVSDNTGSRGTLTLEGTSSLSSTGTIYVSKQADTVASLTIKDSSSVSTNGNLVVGMRAGSNGTLVQNGGSLSVTGETWIGNEGGGNGTFTKTAGTMTANNWFVVGRFGATGVFDFSGGTLTKSNGGQMLIADGGGSVGTMNMSGTANLTVNNGLWVGQNGGNGTLNMSGGTISSNDWMIIGRQTGTGVFNFSGGTVNSNGGDAFVIADKAESDGTNPTTGTLNISGTAELNTTREFWVGNGVNSTGTLNMKGGTIRNNNWIAIGRGGGTGIFNMEGGSFLKEGGDKAFIVGTSGGTGTVNQSGGTITITSGETWISEGATGTWNMSGGSLKSGNLIVGRNGGSTATLNLSGNAQVNTGFFSVGQFDTVKGNVTIADNATLNVARILVGDAGTAQGTVTQTGGTVTEVDGDTAENRIGHNAGTTGTYNLQGGTLSITKNNLHIGGNGVGVFNQTGGTATVGTYPSIGRSAGGVGTMNLSGGTFTQVGNNGSFIVGEEGTGTLNVSGTALLDITSGGSTTGGLIIGLAAAAPEIPGTPADGDIPAVPAVPAVPGGNGTVNLDGGTIRTNYVEARAGKAQLNLNGGTLQARQNEYFEFLRGFTPDNANADIDLKAGGVTFDTQQFDVTTSVNLDGVGGVTKKGTGTLTMWGANSYTGTTKISEGTLVLQGSIAGSVAVGKGATFDTSSLTEFVLAGGNTLSGSGRVLGNKVRLQNGARIAPGDTTPGTLTLQTGLELNNTGGNTLEFGLGTVSDQLAISGGTFLGNHTGVTTISILDAGGLAEGVYTLMTWSGITAQDVDLTDFQLSALPIGYAGSLQLGTDSLQLTVIPEPNTAALLAMTSVGLLGFRRRRRG